jgi:signal transduction histidine kinase
MEDHPQNLSGLEAELKEAKERAENCENEFREFAYIVSHDLKAPIRAVNQLAGWLAQDHASALSDDGKELIKLLRERLDRLNNLMDGVLQYSRIGRIREQEREIDLNGMIRNVLESLNPPHSIQVKVENLPSVIFEPGRIEQLFRHLLDNAIRFMDKPEGSIKVISIDEADRIRFHVMDNGPGIPEKDYDKVFQIFQTLAPKDEVDSVGVGLTLAKKIVESRGGSIWVESEPEKGTSIIFTVPKKPGRG